MVEFTIFGQRVRVRVTCWAGALLCGVVGTWGEPHPIAILIFALALLPVRVVHLVGCTLLHRVFARQRGEFGCGFTGTQLVEKPGAECASVARLVGGMVASLLLVGALGGGFILLAPQAPLGLAWGTLAGSEVPEPLWQAMPPSCALGYAYVARLAALWALVNVLPLYPYDAGMLLVRVLPGHAAAVHKLCLALAALAALGAMALGWWFVAFFFLLITLTNYVHAYIRADESAKRS